MNDRPEIGSGPGRFVARYQLTEADFLVMIAARNRRRPWRQRLFWTFIVLNLLVSVLFVSDAMERGVPVELFDYLNAIVGVILVVVRYTLIPWNWRRYFRKQDLAGKDAVATFDDGGAAITVGGLATQADWGAMKLVERTRTHFLFWISDIQAFIVPFRGFASDGEREAVWQLAQEKTTVTK